MVQLALPPKFIFSILIFYLAGYFAHYWAVFMWRNVCACGWRWGKKRVLSLSPDHCTYLLLSALRAQLWRVEEALSDLSAVAMSPRSIGIETRREQSLSWWISARAQLPIISCTRPRNEMQNVKTIRHTVHTTVFLRHRVWRTHTLDVPAWWKSQ